MFLEEILTCAESALLCGDLETLKSIHLKIKDMPYELDMFLNSSYVRDTYVKKEPPLLFLIKSDNPQDTEIMIFFLNAGANPNLTYETCLTSSDSDIHTRYGNTCGSGKRESSLLSCCYVRKKFNKAELLLQYGANVNARDNMGRPEICKLISGMSLTKVYKQTEDYLNLLVKYNLNTDIGEIQDDSPLIALLNNKTLPKNLELIEKWMKNCKDIDKNKNNSHDLLFCYITAVMKSSLFSLNKEQHAEEMKFVIRIMDYLICKGADVNSVHNIFNKTIGHYIISQMRGKQFSAVSFAQKGTLTVEDCIQLIENLIILGLDINIKNEYQNTIIDELKCFKKVKPQDIENLIYLREQYLQRGYQTNCTSYDITDIHEF